MSKRFRKVDPRFWTDERVQELEDSEQLTLALHMFTGPQSNRIGLYHFSPGSAAELCKIPLGRFPDQMETVLRTLGWHFYEKRRVLFLPHWWRYNEPENPKVLIGNLDDLHDVPITPLDLRFHTNMRDLQARPWKDGSTAADTFIRTYKRKYPDRIRIALDKYPECRALFRDDTYPRAIGQEQKQEQEQDFSAASGERDEENARPTPEAFRKAYGHRIYELKHAGHLQGRRLARAESHLRGGDWDSLERLLAKTEAQIPDHDDVQEEAS